MGSRNDAFGSDPESSSVLKSLGYSDEEIGGTPGEATPDDLRLSLRQLSAAHTSDVQREHQTTTPANPKFEKQVKTPNSTDYWQGRKDEVVARKSNMNSPPKASTRQPATRQGVSTAKQIARIFKTFGGSKSASPGKTLGGVARAQRGRRGR